MLAQRMQVLKPSEVIRNRAQAIEINSVLRNTYLLLSLTLAVCTSAAATAVVMQLPPMNIFMFIAGALGFPLLIQFTAKNAMGILSTFGYAIFLGLAAAPLVGFALNINPMLVVQAVGLTAVTVVGLSMYTIVRKEDFSWLGQFLMIGTIAVIGIIVLSFFVDMSPFSMLISAFMVILASAMILFQTSQIVLGGEKNYIIATASLFASIWILFMNILSLLLAFSGNE